MAPGNLFSAAALAASVYLPGEVNRGSENGKNWVSSGKNWGGKW
jgi:hypothetical protein